MRRYRQKSRLKRSHVEYGKEAAKKHIEEAEKLSERLGGMDKEVKDFFFSLDAEKFKTVMIEYQKKYGVDKRAYAEETYEKWKSGSRKMSGLVAGRLFDLLPPIMPIDLKLRIVEGLFQKSGKQRKDYVLAPNDFSANAIVNFIEINFFRDLHTEQINHDLKSQFSWLAGEDTAVAEQILSHSLRLAFEAKKFAASSMIAQLDEQLSYHQNTVKSVISVISLRQHDVSIKRSASVINPTVVTRSVFDRGYVEPPQIRQAISPNIVQPKRAEQERSYAKEHTATPASSSSDGAPTNKYGASHDASKNIEGAATKTNVTQKIPYEISSFTYLDFYNSQINQLQPREAQTEKMEECSNTDEQSDVNRQDIKEKDESPNHPNTLLQRSRVAINIFTLMAVIAIAIFMYL